MSIKDARQKIENWRKECNEFMPQIITDKMSPAMFAKEIKSPLNIRIICFIPV